MTMVVKTGPADEDLEEAHYLAALASIRVTGAPLKSWERFETATVSPGFTPLGDLHPRALAGPALDQPLLDLAAGDHEHLADAGEVDDGLGGHEGRRGVLPRQDLALGEEAGAQPAVAIADAALEGEAARLHLDRGRHARDLAGEAPAGVGLHGQLDALARLEVGREALGHRARVLERVERHEVEERGVLLDVFARRSRGAWRSRPAKGARIVVSPSRFSAIPSVASRRATSASATRRAARSESSCASAMRIWSGCWSRAEMATASRDSRDVVEVARIVDVARGDQPPAEELLVALELGLRPLDLGLGARSPRRRARPGRPWRGEARPRWPRRWPGRGRATAGTRGDRPRPASPPARTRARRTRPAPGPASPSRRGRRAGARWCPAARCAPARRPRRGGCPPSRPSAGPRGPRRLATVIGSGLMAPGAAFAASFGRRGGLRVRLAAPGRRDQEQRHRARATRGRETRIRPPSLPAGASSDASEALDHPAPRPVVDMGAMAIQRTPMTREGNERLKEELDRLKRVERPAIITRHRRGARPRRPVGERRVPRRPREAGVHGGADQGSRGEDRRPPR